MHHEYLTLNGMHLADYEWSGALSRTTSGYLISRQIGIMFMIYNKFLNMFGPPQFKDSSWH
jgi:hypothetical protein